MNLRHEIYVLFPVFPDFAWPTPPKPNRLSSTMQAFFNTRVPTPATPSTPKASVVEQPTDKESVDGAGSEEDETDDGPATPASSVATPKQLRFAVEEGASMEDSGQQGAATEQSMEEETSPTQTHSSALRGTILLETLRLRSIKDRSPTPERSVGPH